jgi:hypothetical protein
MEKLLLQLLCGDEEISRTKPVMENQAHKRGASGGVLLWKCLFVFLWDIHHYSDDVVFSAERLKSSTPGHSYSTS